MSWQRHLLTRTAAAAASAEARLNLTQFSQTSLSAQMLHYSISDGAAAMQEQHLYSNCVSFNTHIIG
jgi:hypothetical protein